jgi:hypothetical protein
LYFPLTRLLQRLADPKQKQQRGFPSDAAVTIPPASFDDSAERKQNRAARMSEARSHSSSDTRLVQGTQQYNEASRNTTSHSPSTSPVSPNQCCLRGTSSGRAREREIGRESANLRCIRGGRSRRMLLGVPMEGCLNCQLQSRPNKERHTPDGRPSGGDRSAERLRLCACWTT